MRPALCTVAIARAACRRLSLSFARVWDQHLSVLDAEVDGERIVWHVPARAANDTTPITAAPQIAAISSESLGNGVITGRAEIARSAANRRNRQPSEQTGNSLLAEAQLGETGGTAPKPPRKAPLAAWLREQEGGRP